MSKRHPEGIEWGLMNIDETTNDALARGVRYIAALRDAGGIKPYQPAPRRTDASQAVPEQQPLESEARNGN